MTNTKTTKGKTAAASTDKGASAKPSPYEHIKTTLDFDCFDLIASGKKKVEYREGKPYWDKRLLGHEVKTITFTRGYTAKKMTLEVLGVHRLRVTEDAATMTRTITELPLEKPVPRTIYAIHLGKRIEG